MAEVVNLVGLLLRLLAFAILARALLSWFPIDPRGPFGDAVRALHSITNPVLEPLRRIIPPIGMFDISAMVAIFLLFFISSELMRY